MEIGSYHYYNDVKVQKLKDTCNSSMIMHESVVSRVSCTGRGSFLPP